MLWYEPARWLGSGLAPAEEGGVFDGGGRSKYPAGFRAPVEVAGLVGRPPGDETGDGLREEDWDIG